MNFNEETLKNLTYLLKLRKIDAKVKDAKKWTALHYLANNDVREIVKESIKNEDDDEDEFYTIYRRGKAIRRRRYRYRSYRDQDIAVMDSEQDDKEYAKKLKEMQNMQLKCAELLVNEGIKLED